MEAIGSHIYGQIFPRADPPTNLSDDLMIFEGN